ncbi:hypothetical protein N2601_25155 (plasmid) [Rhizobium sp. CB3060]|uniref:hypothetical protein n=1 Tax=Rhizobium sp. CB3060 TaxID=3138255 RepID=UPI0021A2D699|nr:hypothetical protein [Rhizobium tropici]UWU23550.1 hypothetical protein N2601_25155 [Rhizobium tropici]
MKQLALLIGPIRRLWQERQDLITERDHLRAEVNRVSELSNELAKTEASLSTAKASNESFYLLGGMFSGSANAEYMAHSYPVASDFFHPGYRDFLTSFNNHPFQMHRKLWEFAFIQHKLTIGGMIAPGKRGLCFGAGQEPLPALFAARGCTIHATDAPSEIIGEKWTESKEFSRALSDMNYRGMIEEKEFFERVTYSTADMNHIPPDLTGFDFCWSACCLEHLGSIELGLEFIANSLKTIKVGGVSVQTTELNLSSNEETVETGDTVLFRRKDLERFIERMRDEGHEVEGLTVAPTATPIDDHVDVPPYSHNPHLKLLLGQYVSTSVGIVIRRGK